MAGIYWLASYPKSGNTWLRAFLCNLLADGDEPADINALHTGGIASSRAWLDEALGIDSADLTAEEIEALRPAAYRWQRHLGKVAYLKIHDAYHLDGHGEPLVSHEGTLGALYIVRNPLDVAPSVADHFGIGLDEAIDRMADSQWVLGRSEHRLKQQVQQRLLSWSEHVLSWVDAAGLRCHAMRYEDMQRDALATFTAAARFLHLPDDPQRVGKAIRFSDFAELQRQEHERGFRERSPRAARFFRQGRIGDWRERLTPGQIRRIVTRHAEVMRRFGYLDELPADYRDMTMDIACE
ncbi:MULTISPECIES: sulfotransferase domain-containing protein [unclassified Pseudomonas]|uniref:sulfotransferase domain-containing protein n=1 Tax=unclassified Pseudomonas TaxID=196821 RepID=UPI00244CBED5|nr:MULTISPECIES: sulfotransferase domain-containing protein [unclassified Pseudomonas]MDH0895944.1 sulfotransferase domain-containing protein [Pseudomonas sp. GD03875]MDH1067149.1 sulfotransferase domain-containing protein [Pseudomonas sp. GD03985]